jgi:hypothetical protein
MTRFHGGLGRTDPGRDNWLFKMGLALLVLVGTVALQAVRLHG